MERRSTPTAVRADGEANKICGTAAVFYRQGDTSTEYRLWSNAVERIMPTAFDNSLATGDVRALWQHNHDQPMGRTKSGTLLLRKTADGLEYEIEPADTQLYRDALETIRRGDVDGSSFGFRVVSETWREESDGTEVREINEVELYEVSPVTFPAYAGTDAAVRSSDTPDEAMAARDQWRKMKAQTEADQRSRKLQLINLRH